ncbi:MAG: ThuA domain-containing protein [Pirellulales bacterium]|nr:ThuA domain-containing protein [Pirellulales bacterium]
MSGRFIGLGLLLVVGAWAQRASAVEPWADASLPVVAGLELWLDATRPGSDTPAAGPLARWSDASGHGRHLVQPAAAFQPQWVGSGSAPAGPRVRFDGQDDHLAIESLAAEWTDFTLLLVAAPKSNEGEFRGLLAWHPRQANDYVAGLNVDLGPLASPDFQVLNVEGRGFGGAGDLLDGRYALGEFHRLALRGTSGNDAGVQFTFDGQPHGRRPRAVETLAAEQLHLGCRWYRNEPGPPYARGFFDGELAEVLIYSRALDEGELAQVDDYLRHKHAGLLAAERAVGSPIHVLEPGCEVRELPVALPNVNDLLYLDDGRLLALGYDGRIHELTDRDGDGLEEHVEPYWYDTQFRSPIALLAAPDGLYVSANGRVSRLVDDNADGRPDREVVVAADWPQPDASTNGVDAMGLARDAQGNLYFGLGCADFTNAYRVHEGRARYQLADERGTILKLSPDGRREIFCTGIRFPYTLAFNRLGDLFATDQEGETWLPGGNPLDELDHIQPGRHYGFPPRNAQYLPEVRDEPPVVGFGPQHQSTCGLVFNEASGGRRTFGPAAWEGEAFVAGYSRGKLWRCQLVKTAHGYVGRARLLATAELLLVDVALSPRGDLLIACHSGLPDWGSGPQGPGRLFQIRMTEPDAPRALWAWPHDALQVRVALDRPWPEDAGELNAEIQFGDALRAGDRYEALRPGYASVAAQQTAPRGRLNVSDVRLSSDRRTVILTTDPHPYRTNYALRLASGERTLAELDYDFSGVRATWADADGTTRWQGVLPHVDPEVARAWTHGSAEHDALFALLANPGRLTLEFNVAAAANERGEARIGGADPLELRPGRAAKLVCETGPQHPVRVECSTFVADDPTRRALPRETVLIAGAPAQPVPAPTASTPAPEITDGDWYAGRDLFFGELAKCATCHRYGERGGQVGPDLSNLGHRDPGSVLRDIVDPSAAINPDYVQFTIALADGRSLQGLVRADTGDRVRVLDADAKATFLARDEIAALEPNAVSLMPQGMREKLGGEQLRDLVTFLTQREPALVGPPGIDPPAARTPQEVARVMPAANPGEQAAARPLKMVLVASAQDHGPGEHDYPAWQRAWRRMLDRLPGVRVSTAMNWPEPAHWDLADLLVMYCWNHDWSPARLAQLDAYLARGGGLVVIHAATIADRDPQALADRLGLAASFGPAKFRHGPIELQIVAPADEPLTRGLARDRFYDETYWRLTGDPARVNILASAQEEGRDWPMIWTYAPPERRGRVFASILGHYRWTFDDALFRALLLRGMAWAADEPIDRFAPLYEPAPARVVAPAGTR